MSNASNSSVSKKSTQVWLFVCLVAFIAAFAMYKVYRQGLTDGASLAPQTTK